MFDLEKIRITEFESRGFCREILKGPENVFELAEARIIRV